MRRRLSVAAAAGALGALAAPAVASAHGLVGRADLPIPTWLFGWAASAVLIASFMALATLWPRPRLERPAARRLFRIPRALDALCGAIGVGLFALVVYAGLAGTQTATANFAPTFVYVHFWVGLAVLSVLFGDVFRAFNPWLAVGRAASWVAARTIGTSEADALPYPARLGRWPAAAGLLGFAWLELCYVSRDDPSTLALLALGYALVQLVGMGLYGVEAWSRHGDAFGVWFGILSRLSVLERRADGALYLRPPLAGAPQLDAVPGTVALLLVALGSTTFDGLSGGPLWRSLEPHLTGFFGDLGLGPSAALELGFSVGLVVCILAVSGFYRLGVRGMSSVGVGHDTRELSRRFAHSLVPIAFAYALAHYFSLLAYQGQAIAYLASDPLGHGSDIFGTADVAIDYGWMTATGIWYVQVAALVLGHVAGLVLAHDRAIAIYSRVREATRSQYWMLVVMIGFTSLGLWLLSAANR
ncbi:MAG: fenitrothion hydrolase [Thermoleophilaceae bacterium]|nr:fenitrothion hydrolase [Thermoleophilaceae bacterium]